jgi:hypothetical protein
MPIFRQHRGGLKESLDTSIIVHSKADILDCLNKGPLFIYESIPEEDITIEDYGYDNRIGWFTQIVVLKNGVLGFLSEPLVCDENNDK